MYECIAARFDLIMPEIAFYRRFTEEEHPEELNHKRIIKDSETAFQANGVRCKFGEIDQQIDSVLDRGDDRLVAFTLLDKNILEMVESILINLLVKNHGTYACIIVPQDFEFNDHGDIEIITTYGIFVRVPDVNE